MKDYPWRVRSFCTYSAFRPIVRYKFIHILPSQYCHGNKINSISRDCICKFKKGEFSIGFSWIICFLKIASRSYCVSSSPREFIQIARLARELIISRACYFNTVFMQNDKGVLHVQQSVPSKKNMVHRLIANGNSCDSCQLHKSSRTHVQIPRAYELYKSVQSVSFVNINLHIKLYANLLTLREFLSIAIKNRCYVRIDKKIGRAHV